MKITDNEEFKKAYREFAVCGEDYPEEAHKDVMVRNGVWLVYKQGAEAAETILSPRHDTEMEEFEYWKHENVRFFDKELRFFVLIDVEHKLSFSELLAVFRERNTKKQSNK